MREGLAAVTGVVLALAGPTRAKVPAAHAPAKASPAPAKGSPAPPKLPAPPPPVYSWMRSAPSLPVLPSIARVRVEAARDHAVVIEEVSLPRGEWRPGGVELYVAFGAPGTPVAVDARLVSVPDGSQESRPEDTGEALTVEPAVRRGPRALPLLGKPQMAGVVVRVTDGQLRRAYASSDVATLRVRSLLPAPAPDPQGARGVVVRLGAPEGLPLTLQRVQLVSLEPQPWITRAQATLCGPDADPWPLSVAVLPKATAQAAVRSIPPELAVRHASDDLCIHWWASP